MRNVLIKSFRYFCSVSSLASIMAAVLPLFEIMPFYSSYYFISSVCFELRTPPPVSLCHLIVLFVRVKTCWHVDISQNIYCVITVRVITVCILVAKYYSEQKTDLESVRSQRALLRTEGAGGHYLKRILDLDVFPGCVFGGSLGEWTQTEAPHFYVGGLWMTTLEWWGHSDSIYVPVTMASQALVADWVYVSLALFSSVEPDPGPSVPDHHFVLINPWAGGRATLFWSSVWLHRLRLHSPLFPPTAYLNCLPVRHLVTLVLKGAL